VEAGSKFCDRCGAPLAATSPHPAAAAPRFGLPESYTPKHLAEKILTSKSALEGERKQVTVLFADVKGSTELLADRDPEEARKILDPVLERMMEAVHRYEGTVNQVMGDGIMALFGAPLAHEDHAVRACYAAIDLQRAMRGLTETLRQSHGVTVQARVGLNSGEVVVRTISSDHQAGAKAMERSVSTEAAARFEQALDALRHLPESRERTEQAIDLHLAASGAHVAMGSGTKIAEHAREAHALADALGDERRLGRALGRLGARAWQTGDPEHALALTQRALVVATAHDDVWLQAESTQRLGIVWQTTGDYQRAVECLGGVAQVLQGDRRNERTGSGTVMSVFALDRLAWCLAELGEFAEATARADEAGQVAREVDHPRSLVFANRSSGLVLLRRGDLRRAIPLLERSVELCRGIPAEHLIDVSAAHLGYAYVLSGRLPDGVALLEEALADPAVTGIANHPLFLAYLGEAHLRAGRRDEALTVARRALDLAHRQKERGNEAWVLRLLGEITAQADPPDLPFADAHYRQALALAEPRGMRPLVAHCHLGLGALYWRAGDAAKAQEDLTTARNMYREMGMTFWLEKAEAVLGPSR
jgi:tetratricopeptide (TPR) repeat protein